MVNGLPQTLSQQVVTSIFGALATQLIVPSTTKTGSPAFNFSSTGSFLASGNRSGAVRIWRYSETTIGGNQMIIQIQLAVKG